MKNTDFEKLIFSKLHSKYKVDNTIYALNVIDNIVFNERSHLVSKFKDYLILDDEFEFLKRYYNSEDSQIRLKNFLSYYSKYQILFPNYSCLKEADFILKNIFNKQQMAENLDNSIKQRKKEKTDFNSNENLSNTVFNSKVYESIINDSENCLSIFSNDKESLYSGNYIGSNKKEDGINKLINKFEEVDPDYTFSFRNKKDKILKLDSSLTNELNLDTENNNDNNYQLTDVRKYEKIYKKKKTPNNSINKRTNIICSSIRTQSPFYINKKENIDYNNYKNLVLYSENNHNNQMNILSKKLNLNNLINPIKKNSNSSMPYLSMQKEKSDNNKMIKYPYHIKNNKSNVITLKSNNKNINSIINNIKINEAQTKEKLLTERVPPIIKVKINMKKNNNKINIDKIKNNIIKKNIINNSENQKQKIKIDKNKICYLKQKANNEKKGILYSNNIKYQKLNIVNNLINDDNSTNKDFLFKSIEKFDTYRSHSNNIFKNSKINLIKKNIDYNINTDYVIKKYKNKLSNYNNYTSIQFNNNNINIINSNSNNINNNSNNIFNQTYGSSLHKSNELTFFSGVSNSGNNKSLDFKNKRKKLNKKCVTYFYSNNTEKIDTKFKYQKKLKFLENLSTLNNGKNDAKIKNVNSLSQHHRQLNSERISTPFNSKLNQKIYFKIYKKVNLSNNKDKKKKKQNETIVNETNQKYKGGFESNKKLKDFSTINNQENIDKFNYTHMSQFNKTRKNKNSINLNNSNNSNLINMNSSLFKKKRNKYESEIIYYKNIDKTELSKNNLCMNISKIYKDKTIENRNSNNLAKLLKKKKVKKDDELLEIKKLEQKKNMVINEFNEKMDEIKMKFIKEIENKFEISKRNIINKRKYKNKLNVNTNF